MKTTENMSAEVRRKRTSAERLDDLYNPKPRTAAKPASGAKKKPVARTAAKKTASAAPARKAPAKKKAADWDNESLFSSKFSFGKASDAARKTAEEQDTEKIFGTELNFAAKEAYKLLRTNLMFSLPSSEGSKGHIIGMTSALRGEGKSTTTINLARVLAEQDKKVIVVEGDLRLPSLRKKLKITVENGLSHVLISRANPLDYTRPCSVGMMEDKEIFVDMLMAGAIPPNPSELLGSRRMEEVLNILAENYDFVLLDLPPVTAVSDALVATKLVDGVVLVVRNEHCNTGSLNEAIRQIQLVEGKILGFVFTCASSNRGVYRKKYNYRYYSYSE